MNYNITRPVVTSTHPLESTKDLELKIKYAAVEFLYDLNKRL